MKKLFLSLAVVMSVSLFSCGNGASNENADSTCCDSATVVEETVVLTDSVAAPADSVAAAADTTAVAE